MEFHHFSSGNRVGLDLDKLNFKLLNILLEAGEDYVNKVNAQKANDKERREVDTRRGVKSRKGKGQTLAARDPW